MRLAGIFLQIVAFRSEETGKQVATPLIIGKELERLPEQLSGPQWPSLATTIALGILTLAAISWVAFLALRRRPRRRVSPETREPLNKAVNGMTLPGPGNERQKNE